jgi:hypothetical protein
MDESFTLLKPKQGTRAELVEAATCIGRTTIGFASACGAAIETPNSKATKAKEARPAFFTVRIRRALS